MSKTLTEVLKESTDKHSNKAIWGCFNRGEERMRGRRLAALRDDPLTKAMMVEHNLKNNATHPREI